MNEPLDPFLRGERISDERCPACGHKIAWSRKAPSELGGKIRNLRLAQSLTAAEFARRVGVSRQRISDIEISGRMPTLQTIQRLAAGLRMPVGEFVEAIT